MTPGTTIPPASDNNLINGKMNFNCNTITDGTYCTPNAGISKFQFQPGKVHRLRLINSGSEGTQQVFLRRTVQYMAIRADESQSLPLMVTI